MGVKIIGAGLSGMLCGILNPNSVILERAEKNNKTHKAVLRMKNNEISKLLGIDFKKVSINKSIWFEGKDAAITPRLAHMYSMKNLGFISQRSIFNLNSEIRYIPPDNFHEILESMCNISYGMEISDLDINKNNIIISTIPMESLSKIIHESIDADFKYSPIYVNTFEISNCDSYVTIYYPGADNPIYRATITKSTLIIESNSEIDESYYDDVFESFGLINANITRTKLNHIQKFGKIIGIKDSVRKNFILNATVKYNIFSLGRFATWRPKVTMDDVLKDIFVIKKLISRVDYEKINFMKGT